MAPHEYAHAHAVLAWNIAKFCITERFEEGNDYVVNLSYCQLFSLPGAHSVFFATIGTLKGFVTCVTREIEQLQLNF